MPLILEENVPLAPLTTLGIGGAARHFVRAETEDAVLEAVEIARTRMLPLLVLGRGSNVLISDEGFDGIVLQIGLKGVAEKPLGDGMVEVTAAAGEDWDSFVAYCVERDLAGVECLSGIPGLVGGTPIQNVGAYGQDVSESITRVRCLDRRAETVVTLSAAECEFRYRSSIFNREQRERYIILDVTYALRSGGRPKIVYPDLLERLKPAASGLRQVRETVLAIRRSKSMVLDPNDPNSRSVGSFFRNPVVTPARFEALARQYPELPSFAAHGGVKIPAAWLIEQAGFKKGLSLGRVGISENHALALINKGDATANEIVRLKNMIQDAVLKKFGIELEPEPVFVGF